MRYELDSCPCFCHAPPDGIWYVHGVSLLDVVEAACACTDCIDLHAPALLSRRLANDIVRDPRERAVWVDRDPIQRQADGDGDSD